MDGAWLVLGKGGKIGSALVAAGWGRGVGREEIDLADGAALREFLRREDFGGLVNAAAVTDVDACEAGLAWLWAVNVEAPGVMAAECRRRGVPMVQLSTDYVFGGESDRELVEEDEARPLSVYGRSKLEGERRVFEACPGALVVRTSWIFGRGGEGFPDMVLRAAREGGKLSIVVDKWAVPTGAEELVSNLGRLVGVGAEGLVHVVSDGGGCSWRDYAGEVLSWAAARGEVAEGFSAEEISLDEAWFFRAPRPRYTVLGLGRYEELTGVRPRGWREVLGEYLEKLKG
jgi:dTDP-4-dehydrorhamnose reductase